MMRVLPGILATAFFLALFGCSSDHDKTGITDIATRLIPFSTPSPSSNSGVSVSLSTDFSTLSESSGSTVTLTATANRPVPQDLTVMLGFGGTVTQPSSRYNVSSNQIVILKGRTQGAVTITPINDNIYQNDETIIVSIQTVTGASDASTPKTITLTNDEAVPSVVLVPDDAGINEGQATTLHLHLNRPTAYVVSAALVFDALSSTATANEFSLSATTLTIPALSTDSATVTLSALHDEEYNPSFEKDIVLQIGSLSNAVAGNSTPPLSIFDIDPDPSWGCLNGGTGVRLPFGTECSCSACFMGDHCELYDSLSCS